MNAPLTLAQVAASWMQAKEDERKAIEHRRALDKMIVDMMPKQDEGSVTENTGDYKITATYKLDRKIDTTALQLDWAKLPAKATEAIKWKADLSVTQFRGLSEQDKLSLSPYITTKPASTSVSVEIVL